MIFHINRMTFKAGLSEEQREAGLDLMRQAGAANPVVKSYVVGPELGGEFEHGAVYVVEDLDGYWAYLTHPALQARNYQEHPEMAALVAQAPSFTTPDGTGSAA
jgi:hypothetical protein